MSSTAPATPKLRPPALVGTVADLEKPGLVPQTQLRTLRKREIWKTGRLAPKETSAEEALGLRSHRLSRSSPDLRGRTTPCGQQPPWAPCWSSWPWRCSTHGCTATGGPPPACTGTIPNRTTRASQVRSGHGRHDTSAKLDT